MTEATRNGIIQMLGEACEHIERYPKALIGITSQYFVDEEKILFSWQREDQSLQTPDMYQRRKII